MRRLLFWVSLNFVLSIIKLRDGFFDVLLKIVKLFDKKVKLLKKVDQLDSEGEKKLAKDFANTRTVEELEFLKTRIDDVKLMGIVNMALNIKHGLRKAS
jgi:hypothetical protein